MIDLRPIRIDEGAAALAVLDVGSRELRGQSADEIRSRYDPLDDLHEPAAYYASRGGVFLVLAEEERVVGIGGIIALAEDATVAELKRFWILPSYRRQGLGRRMLESLLVFARAHDYRSVRLEVATPDVQGEALRLFARLGFRPMTPYRAGPCELAMERTL